MGASGRLLPELVVRWGGSTVHQEVLGFLHLSGEVSIVQTGSYISQVPTTTHRCLSEGPNLGRPATGVP